MPRANKSIAHSLTPQPEPTLVRHPDPAALAELFEQWMRADEEEQRTTFEFLRRALDEDRPAGHRLFS